MGKEQLSMVAAAPGAHAQLADTHIRCPVEQHSSQVERPGPPPWLSRDLFEDIRINFITLAANAYPTMHYYVRRRAFRALHQLVEPAFQDAGGNSPPTGVQERHAAG